MNAPDLSVYYAVHAGLRKAAHRLAETAGSLDPSETRPLKAFRSYWKGYEGEVLTHHTVEDDFFFVALSERVPVARDYMARIGAEHHDLDELMSESGLAIGRVADGVDGAAAAAELALKELAVHMDAHLDFEDANILPLFVRHFTAEEYSELDERAMKSLGIGRQAAFSVPFVVSSVSPEERVRLIAEAPLPLRALYRMTRGHYDRMTAAAFGRRVLEEVR
jgi:hemerythrin-like domain-containing protein